MAVMLRLAKDDAPGQYAAVLQHMEHLAASSVNADIMDRGKHVYDLRLRFVVCQYKETHPLRRQQY